MDLSILLEYFKGFLKTVAKRCSKQLSDKKLTECDSQQRKNGNKAEKDHSESSFQKSHQNQNRQKFIKKNFNPNQKKSFKKVSQRQQNIKKRGPKSTAPQGNGSPPSSTYKNAHNSKNVDSNGKKIIVCNFCKGKNHSVYSCGLLRASFESNKLAIESILSGKGLCSSCLRPIHNSGGHDCTDTYLARDANTRQLYKFQTYCVQKWNT